MSGSEADVRDWKVNLAQADLNTSGLKTDKFIQIAYRPFDIRYTYYTGRSRGIMCMPRNEIMKHLLKENIALCIGRQFVTTGSEQYDTVFVNDKPVDLNFYRRGGEAVFPLYLYDFPEDRKPKVTLIDENDPFGGKERIENFSKEFRAFMDKQYGQHYSPEDILGYIYAVLHSPTYRRKYMEFLKIDFPRIPFIDECETFEALAKLGMELVQAHLLKDIPNTPKVDITKGSRLVEKPVYDEKHQRLYINQEQYFSSVPKEAWDFYIGGYQVLDKYLKSRKDRTLSLDEIETFQNVVKVLCFTHGQMQKIDEAWTIGR